MKAYIFTIGDEILIGQINDTNSGYIARALNAIGIEIAEIRSVSDERTHILQSLEQAQDNVDLVIMTGGLGPTKDDITKKTLCEYFDDQLVSNTEVLAHVKTLIEKYTGRAITQLNIDQALIPSKAEVLFNDYGTAAGMWMKKGNTVFISLPGVPFEMKHLIDDKVVPKLVQTFKRPFIIHKTVMTYGQGESIVAERIASWEEQLPTHIRLAYLPAPGRVRLRVSGRGEDRTLLEHSMQHQLDLLSAIIGDIIVGIDGEQCIEQVVSSLLQQNGLTVALAESCSGGKLSHLLTAIPGASSYFRGSVVCYHPDIKVQLLGVSPESIKSHSVVSAEVAKEMAAGAARVLDADFGIGITGNAGPTTDKETDEKAGVVFIAITGPEGEVCERFDFGQPREKVIERAAIKSLEMLQKQILKNVL